MANQWLRLYSEFATDPKVQMMNEAYQRRFIMLLCMRCSNADVTLHDDEIAFQLRIDVTEWMSTKTVFISKGLIDSDNKVLAWDKRQFSSDSSAERVSRHRDRKKQECNVTVTPPDADTDTDTEQKQSKSKASSATGSRLPLDWSPSAEEIKFCKAERPDLAASEVANRFRDYWAAQPGAKGRKSDWAATWRNWVRNERSAPAARASPAQNPSRLSPAGQATAQAAQQWLENENAA